MEEKAKNARRAAKSSLTRTMNAVSMLMNAKRPANEIQQGFVEAKNAHSELVIKHKEYTIFLNDESKEEAESSMMDCTENYTRFAIEVTECLRCLEKEKKKNNNNNRRALKHQFPEMVAPNQQAMKSLYKQRVAITMVNKMKAIQSN